MQQSSSNPGAGTNSTSQSLDFAGKLLHLPGQLRQAARHHAEEEQGEQVQAYDAQQEIQNQEEGAGPLQVPSQHQVIIWCPSARSYATATACATRRQAESLQACLPDSVALLKPVPPIVLQTPAHQVHQPPAGEGAPPQAVQGAAQGGRQQEEGCPQGPWDPRTVALQGGAAQGAGLGEAAHAG